MVFVVNDLLVAEAVLTHHGHVYASWWWSSLLQLTDIPCLFRTNGYTRPGVFGFGAWVSSSRRNAPAPQVPGQRPQPERFSRAHCFTPRAHSHPGWC